MKEGGMTMEDMINKMGKKWCETMKVREWC